MERLSGETLPRIMLDIRGLEWFVYNRSQAYEAVLAAISQPSNRSKTYRSGTQQQATKINPATAHPSNTQPFKSQDDETSREPSLASSSIQQHDGIYPGSSELPGFLKLFPIGVRCKKTAMVMGNRSTASILVATASAAEGLIDARGCSPEDIYKQCFDFVLENLVIKFRRNEDYIESVLDTGAKQQMYSNKAQHDPGQDPVRPSKVHTKHKLLAILSQSNGRRKSSTESSIEGSFARPQYLAENQGKWLGLSRYLEPIDDEVGEHGKWRSIEYAKASTIAECPRTIISFFWDVPGRVLHLPLADDIDAQNSSLHHVNNGPAPEWGFHINIAGGTINYGPWADKQRANLQNVFFPSSYSSAIPAQPLKPGQPRQSTEFKIVIILDEAVHLRLHTREESKDSKWKTALNKVSKTDHDRTKKTSRKHPDKDNSDVNVRPAGWLYLTIAANTSCTYAMDMLASAHGFGNKLEVDVPGFHLTTSVNHGVFMRCKSLAMNCDLSNPLVWNGLRTWLFTVTCHDLEAFFLRDHAFLLTDLINDWTYGPPNDFMTFIPFLYKFDLDLHDVKIHLNVNDANIIDVPASLVDNAYLRFGAKRLSTALEIPASRYQPRKNAIRFESIVDNLYLELLPPTWNTLHSLLEDKRIGTAKQLKLKGCYDYYTSNSPSQTDILTLDLGGESLTLHVYGFLIRHFMVFRENYFGDDMHFQTLEEYQHKLSAPGGDPSTKNQYASSKVSNDLDVILTINAKNSCLVLPTRIYSAVDHVKADIPILSLDLRFTNYYMDLDLSLSPISLRKSIAADRKSVSDAYDSKTQMFLNGLWISGHRLFGLPPTEPTYVCNWDIVLGRLNGECSLEFTASLAASAQAFVFQFKDIENALPRNQQKTVHDVTFLRVKMAAVNVWLHVQDSAIQLQLGELDVEFNDLAGETFSERLLAHIPQVSLGIVDTASANRQRTQNKKGVVTYGLLRTSISLRTATIVPNFEIRRQLQQDYITKHDSRTQRTPWLLLNHKDTLRHSGYGLQIKPKPPAMPIPPMPGPIGSDDVEQVSLSSSSQSNPSNNTKLKNQSSFLSISSDTNTKLSSPARSAHKTLNQSVQTVIPRHDKTPLLRSTSMFATSPKLTLSSPYTAPHFLLQNVEPDTKDLPSLSLVGPKFPVKTTIDSRSFQIPEDEAASSTIIVSCEPGITAFFTPEALKCVFNLILALQPVDPGQILDDIQMTALPRVPLAFNKPKAIMSNQFRFELPQLALRFITQSTIPNAPFEWQTYEAGLSSLNLIMRFGPSRKIPDPAPLAAYLSLESFRMAVRGQQSESTDDEARVQLNLASTIAWLHSNGKVTGRVQPDGLEIISLNRKVEYLAAIVNNALTLVESISPDLEKVTKLSKARQQNLVHFLSNSNHDLADPVFLNNASYIARATSEHARNSDTWKMVSRLRYVLDNLSRLRIQELERVLAKSVSKLGLPQVEEVFSAFNQWRGWDLEYLRSSALMSQVFGIAASPRSPTASGVQLSFSLNLDSIIAVVDPGPTQNQIELHHLALSAESAIDLPSEPLLSSRRTTTVTLFCDETVIQLNWEILEFVEGVLSRLVKNPNVETTAAVDHIAMSPAPRNRCDHRFHFVTGFETIDVGFKTINLDITSLTRSLKTSTILWQTAGSISGANTAINADFNVSKISSHSQLILVVQLLKPFLHGAFSADSVAENTPRLWNAGGLCQKLELEIHQDLLGLLGIADLLIRDEISYIHSLISIVSHDTEGNTKTPVQRSAFKAQHKIHVALLLEDYRLSLALLSSLHYVLHGHIARSMAQATVGSQLALTTSFDVKEHVHIIENHTGQVADEISRFLLPPIGARIVLSKEESVIRAAMLVCLEKILLDASAIHALLSTSSRQEVSSFRKNVSRDLAILQSNYRAVFSAKQPAASTTRKSVSSMFFYKLELIADGLEVEAITAKTSKQPARLVLDIGPSSVTIQNESSLRGKLLLFLEANANIGAIKVFLERTSGHGFHSCGDVLLGFSFHSGSVENEYGKNIRSINVTVTGPEINIYAETAPTIVDILGYIQQKFKDFSLSEELHGLRARRNRSKSIAQPSYGGSMETKDGPPDTATALFNTMFSVELFDLQVAWRVGDLLPISPGHDVEDLIFSIENVNLATRHANSAQLVMVNLQLQMVPKRQSSRARSKNSALMPEVLFNVAYVSTLKDRKFAFQAVGKSVDLRLTPKFVLPAVDLQHSMALATQDLRKVIADWNASFIGDEQNKKVITAKRISSILIDADFAGAVINLQPLGDTKSPISPYSPANIDRRPGNADQLRDLGRISAILRTPGIAFKVEYNDHGTKSRALSAEIRINASSNTLQPSIVPLILELTNSIREVVHEKDVIPSKVVEKNNPVLVDEELMSKPVAILGDCKLNLGLRICRQKFGLSCQPIAKVEARTEFEDVYITINTVEIDDQDRFFTLSAKIQNLQASVQHTYSQEATGRFAAEHIELSLMNSRHVSDMQGISAILNFGPMKFLLNVRQLHDFLLFREIWLPEELQQPQATETPSPIVNDETHGILMQRYQQVAASNPFPWNATIVVEEVDVELDLGQSLGRSSFQITRLWTVSRKISNWEQNLHVGFNKMKLDCIGRLDCYLGLENMALRTSIKWPEMGETSHQIPLIQASLGFDDFKIKASFEYQSFLVGNFSSLKFLMYNVREGMRNRDRLVCTIDGDKIQAFCTTQSSASILALYQAMQRLILEKRQSFESSLRDIHRYYKRTAIESPHLDIPKRALAAVSLSKDDVDRTPLQLQTNVVISLKQLNIGAYPRSFVDNTIFKLEALGAGAKFSVVLKDNNVQSSLGLSLGQVRIALSSINRGQPTEELSVDDIVRYSTSSRGGTILKVPRVNATMQTWQNFDSTMIEYIFRSSFEGKVEVGWNINRINVIRTMWNTHSKALASRLGKALPQSAVHITGVPTEKIEGKEKQDKITAVVNVPISKYSYTAREPPVIETPQLRDMGEATPPLEWIGLQREKLPNLTHQIIIVPLLEVAKEVEDAYSKILGAS